MTAAIPHPFKPQRTMPEFLLRCLIGGDAVALCFVEAKSEEAARSIMLAGYNVAGWGKVDEVLTSAPNIAGEGSAVRIGGVIYDCEFYSASEKSK